MLPVRLERWKLTQDTFQRGNESSPWREGGGNCRQKEQDGEGEWSLAPRTEWGCRVRGMSLWRGCKEDPEPSAGGLGGLDCSEEGKDRVRFVL